MMRTARRTGNANKRGRYIGACQQYRSVVDRKIVSVVEDEDIVVNAYLMLERLAGSETFWANLTVGDYSLDRTELADAMKKEAGATERMIADIDRVLICVLWRVLPQAAEARYAWHRANLRRRKLVGAKRLKAFVAVRRLHAAFAKEKYGDEVGLCFKCGRGVSKMSVLDRGYFHCEECTRRARCRG